jgi:20S proteasome alpha/beta subunit
VLRLRPVFDWTRRIPVTVCIAALFRWNYAPAGEPERLGVAAITASDRMITAGDVQYEPQQLKVAHVTERILILIAGDFSMHTQAIKATIAQTRGNPNVKPHDVAVIYGKAVQAIKHRQAEDLFLAPLGLNTDTFFAQQKEMSEPFVSTLTSQMQNYRGDDVEALVVGSDNDIAQIYAVESNGVVNCFDDVGFAAIGIGAWHAKSRLMQFGYTNMARFAPALAAVLAAKKSAEIAPGIGSNTDIHLIFKDAAIRLWPNVATRAEELSKCLSEEFLNHMNHL